MAMPTFNFPKTEPGKRPVMLLTAPRAASATPR